MRLRLRQTLRQHSRRELDQQYNPINLDYIYDADDPLAPWLEEREEPVFNPDDISWLDASDDDPLDGDGTDPDVLPGTSATVPVRLRDDDDTGGGSGGSDDDDDDDGGGGGSGGGGGDGDDDDDDDDDTGSGGHPPGFGSGGHDYFPTPGSSTPLYDQYGYGGSGGGGGGSGTSGGASGSHRDEGKKTAGGERPRDIGEIGGGMSLLYLHNNEYGHVHYPMPSQDSSSISSSRFSMDFGHRYGDDGQSDMASQLATSLFGGNYDQYQQPEDTEDYGYNQNRELPRKSFWW